MKYHSTRAKSKTGENCFSFSDVLFSPGYAQDGGLFVPESIPTLTKNDLIEWKNLDYRGVVKKMLRLFVSRSEMEDDDIHNVVSSSYREFEFPEVISLVETEDQLIIAELFKGPTLAFKDLSLCVLAKLLEFFLKKNDQDRLTILVGTSGDTGPAAAHAVSNLEKIDLILLYPLQRVSQIQELQMLTMDVPNVHVCAVEGTSDDLDVPIKECFQEIAFCEKHRLGSLNSLQWGRVLLQTAHYIYIYLQSCRKMGDKVTIIVPTGAAGNLAAGFLAHEMGLPIELVATVNVNDILDRSLKNGDFSTSESVAVTLAPAMDIQAPYNIERLLYFATKGNSDAVRDTMHEFEKCGNIVLSPEILHGLRNVIVETISVSDEQISLAIRRCYQNNRYIVCPHTATAVFYYYTKRESSPEKVGVHVCLATASPAKFPDAFQSADVRMIPTNPRIEQLKIRARTAHLRPKHIFRRGQDWTSQLKNIIASI